jgi:hypothetical protein
MPEQRLPGRLAAVKMDGELPRRSDVGTVFDELDYQMATQAYLWALPLVAFAQWRHQHREVFGATNFDLVHYVTYRDRLGIITANATTPYILNFVDLSETGPLVVELPPGPTAGGVSDFWQREFGVMGEMGPDGGRGGKHLIVPPGQEPPDADGHNVLRSTGMNIFFGFRILDPDPRHAEVLLGGVKIYPFDRRNDPPRTRLISPDGRPWSGEQPRGIEYWERLHEIYQSEVVDERDRFYLAMLKQLGIEKGKSFEPDERLERVLVGAAAAGELMARANTFTKRFEGARRWPDRQWDLVIVLGNSSQRGPYYDELLERASYFYEAVTFSEAMKSQTAGPGRRISGPTPTPTASGWTAGRTTPCASRQIPPAKLFWSVTVYDVHTRCLIDNDQQRGDRGSRDADLRHNDDGSSTCTSGLRATRGEGIELGADDPR